MDLERKAVSANRENSETFVIWGDTESSRPYHIFLLQHSESLLFCISPLAFVYCGGRGIAGGTSGKEPTCQCRKLGFQPWVRKIPGGSMAARFSILTWEIPWIEEPSGQQSIGLQSQTQLKRLSMQAYCGSNETVYAANF